MNLFLPVYSTAAAAKAAGVNPGTLATRLARGELRADDRLEALRHPGTGRSRTFSAIRVLQIALGERLARSGLEAKRAYDLALAFTGHGTFDAAKGGLVDERIPDPRPLGGVYPDGTTVFRVLYPHDATAPLVASIDRLEDVRDSLLIRDHERFASVLLIDLNDLRSRTLALLGADA